MKTHLKRTFLFTALLSLLLASAGSPAAAQASETLDLYPNSGPAGSSVYFKVNNFPAKAPGVILFDSSQVATFDTDAAGSAGGYFNVPAGAAYGGHKVQACLKDGSICLTANFTVLQPTDVPTKVVPVTPTSTRDVGFDTPTPTLSVSPTPAGGNLGTSLTTTTLQGFPAMTIAYGQRLFNNPASVLGGSVARLPFVPPCGGLSIGAGAIRRTFDDLPTGALSNAYQGAGVLFAPGHATVEVPGVPAHSGSLALTNAMVSRASIVPPTASDVGASAILMNFTQPVSAVGMFVGREAPGTRSYEAVVAVLTGYGLDPVGNLVPITSSLVELPGSPTPIDRCLQINAPTGQTIRSATLEFLDSHGYSAADRRWMDDLTFLPVAGPAVDLTPRVTIRHPYNGETVRSEAVWLTADITEDIALERVRISVNDNPAYDLLPSDIQRDATDPSLYHVHVELNLAQIHRNRTNNLTVWAIDNNGHTGEAFSQFVFQPGSSIDIVLRTNAVEITQAVQCLGSPLDCPDNSLPLFTGRPTMVRAYPVLYGRRSGYDLAALSNIGGALCLGSTGESGCSNPLRPTAGIPLSGHSTPRTMRNSISTGLNFVLPQEWVGAGPLTVTVYVNYNQENVPEQDYSNNYTTLTLPVIAGKTMEVVFVQVNANGFSPDMGLIWPIADGLFARYPVSRVRVMGIPAVLTGTYDLAQHSGWGSVLDDLRDLRDEYDMSSLDYARFYGLIPILANSARATFGMGFMPGLESTGEVSTDIVGTQNTAAHELGHNQGRNHISAAGGASNPDPNYPYPGGLLDETGVDVRRANVFSTSADFDFMSYHSATDSWISAYTYRAIYNAIGSLSSLEPAGGQLASPSLQGEPARYLTGGGELSPQSAGLFGAFFTQTRLTPLYDGLPAGPYTLQLQDAQGTVLFNRYFGIPAQGCGDEPGEAGSFQFSVPWVEGSTALVILYNDQEMIRRNASPNAPQVQITYPLGGEAWGAAEEQTITWSAADADGGQLAYIVQFSPDKGVTWLPLAIEMQATSLVVNTASLPGTSAGLIRVIASDGFNSTEAYLSDMITVASKPPQIHIANPQEAGELPAGWPVILNAYSLDLQDGELPAESLRWSSDRDGDLGSGYMLIASDRDMALGEHLITVTGTDSLGLSSSAQTTIRVTAGYVPPEHPARAGVPWWVYAAAAGGLALLAAGLVWIAAKRRKKSG